MQLKVQHWQPGASHKCGSECLSLVGRGVAAQCQPIQTV